jgi:hypothetical protein
MQALSDTLEAMKLNEGLPKEPQHGLTMTGGALTIAPREQPLTENNLTAIASRLLLGSPAVRFTKKKRYGRKLLKDEYGAYGIENEPVGEEDSAEIDIVYRDGLKREVLEAALRASPPQATLGHLTRLAVHKRLGSGDQDRAILLNDYTEALRAYPDFVVYVACRSLWETTESPFYPKIKQISDLCEMIYQSFTAMLRNLKDQKTIDAPVKRGKYDKSQWYESPKDNPLRRDLCDFLVGKGEPDYFEMTMAYSNYQLEIIACNKFGYRKEAA